MLTLNESNDPYVHLSDSDLCLQLASDYPDLIAFLCAKIDPQNRSAYPNFAAPQPSCTFFCLVDDKCGGDICKLLCSCLLSHNTMKDLYLGE